MKGALFSLGSAAVALSATGLDTAMLRERLDAAIDSKLNEICSILGIEL